MRVGVEEAWCAGFFDGEGNVSYVKELVRTPRIYAQLSQVYRDPLDRFARVVEMGKVRGPYSHKVKNHQAYHTWSVEGFHSVRHLFMRIGPFLSPIKFVAFADGLDRLDDWKRTVSCEKHQVPMSIDVRGGVYCSPCRTNSGRRAADARWHA